ncbi:MAG: ribose 5-phosphate isomerase B [Anaerolineae bacterium]
MDELRVRRIVRKVAEETLGEHAFAEPPLSPDAPHDARVPDRPAARPATTARIHLAPGTERTDEIEELAAARDAEVVDGVRSAGSSERSVALGADHGGYALKESLKVYLAGRGYRIDDCGTFSPDPVDYPDLAAAVALKVASGKAWRGIVVDGAGIGSSMAANKIAGVRAALCYDLSTARNAREHNDANLLTLGGSLIGEGLARQIADAFLTTAFAEGRHRRRVEQIMALEREPALLETNETRLPAGSSED